MDTSNLKNIVVLKDLPSNLVEEAIVVLKQNKKVQKLEIIEKENKKSQIESSEKGVMQQNKDYIIKEAQMLISEYISNIENKNKVQSPSFQKLKEKNKKLKTLNYILICCLLFSILINFSI